MIPDPVAELAAHAGIDADALAATLQAYNDAALAGPARLAALTPMGEAVQRSLALLRERKEIYKQNGLDYFRPWMFVISEGKPTDKGWEAAADQIKQEELRRGVIFYGVGVENADMRVLARFSDVRPPLKLKGLAFDELFM